ncbi:hypothetical protein ACP3S7_12360 [Phytobacter ursingii]
MRRDRLIRATTPTSDARTVPCSPASFAPPGSCPGCGVTALSGLPPRHLMPASYLCSPASFAPPGVVPDAA